MFKNKFNVKKNKSSEDIHYSCSVQFLDDTAALSVTYQKEAKGQYLIDFVCQNLDLIEKDYFGLRYVNTDKQRCWLDPVKSIHGQLKGIQNPLLCFRVKYYPSDPSRLKEEITRYQLFLQVKKDLQRGRLLSSKEDAIILCAYIVQSELGDYDPEEHLPNYVSQMKNLPKIVQGSENEIMEQHKTLVGQVPAEAEVEFLKKAAELDSYGMDPHIVVDLNGTQLYLAVNHQGIMTFQNYVRTHFFKWPQIKRLSFSGRMFIIRLFNIDNEDNAILLKRHVLSPPSCQSCTNTKTFPTCGFKCESTAASKYLWKCAVEQKFFFTLQSGIEAPKVVTGGGLFRRGSKLRFSGRCEKEVNTSIADITREEPRFIRSPSNADIARTYNSMRSATLPASWRQNLSFTSEEHVAVLEMNFNEEPSFLSLGETKEMIHDSSIMEEVHESEEEEDEEEEVAERKEKHEEVVEDNNKEDEGISSTGAETYEPVDENVQLPSSVEMIVEDASMVKEALQETESIPSCGYDSKGDESPTTAFIISQPELDAEIKALQLKLDSKITESNHCVSYNKIAEDKELKNLSSNPHLDNELSVNPLVPATAIVNPLPSPNAVYIPAPRKQRRRCYKVFVTLFVTIFILLVIAVLILEFKVDFPMIGDLNLLPPIHDFKVRHYIPIRDVIEEMVHDLLGM